MMFRKKTKKGFTLTELTVAIVFVSILLLTIAVVTLNMIHIYHKGATMKSVNSIGLALIDDFTSAITASPPLDPESLCKGLGKIGSKNANGMYDGGDQGADSCMNDGALRYVYQQFYSTVKVTKNGSTNNFTLPVAGVFCTGKYSYVWNTGYAIQNKQSAEKMNEEHTMSSGFYEYGNADIYPLGIKENPTDSTAYYFRLQKYSDSSRTFCLNNFPILSGKRHYPLLDGYIDDPDDDEVLYLGSSSEKAISKDIIEGKESDPPDPTTDYDGINDLLFARKNSPLKISDELIKTSDIAIYSIKVERPLTNNSGRTIYKGTITLGSITGDIEVHDDYAGCNVKDTISFDVEYCAANKFNFAIRAMGGNSSD